MLENKNSNSECTLICIHTALCRSYGVIMMQPHAYINQNQHGRMTMPSTLDEKYWFMLWSYSFKKLHLVHNYHPQLCYEKQKKMSIEITLNLFIYYFKPKTTCSLNQKLGTIFEFTLRRRDQKGLVYLEIPNRQYRDRWMPQTISNLTEF